MRRLSEQNNLGVCVKGAEQLADGDELALLAFSPADGAVDERKEALVMTFSQVTSLNCGRSSAAKSGSAVRCLI